MNRQTFITLMESLASHAAGQLSHTYPALSGPVAPVVLHYALKGAERTAKSRLSRKNRKRYENIFDPKQPKTLSGQFTKDIAGASGLASGVYAAKKYGLSTGKTAAMALAGEVIGNYIGKTAAKRVDNALK